MRRSHETRTVRTFAALQHHAHLQMNIRETIEQALSSAGLGNNTTTAKVREVIDRA